MPEKANNRQEQRFAIASAILPFLANRTSDYHPFQYLVQDLSASGIKIAIPNWVYLREHLYLHDKISLHVPFKFSATIHKEGEVVWQKWDRDLDAQICGLYLHTPAIATYPVYISLSTKEINIDLQDFQTTERLLSKILWDSTLLKQGLLIYLRHLNSYFLRTSLISRQDYAIFRQTIITDIFEKVKSNHQQLQSLYQEALNYDNASQIFAQVIDLEELRKLMQPEVYIGIFQNILTREVVERYLKAIKTLEEKIYVNYNTLVMLYMQDLG